MPQRKPKGLMTPRQVLPSLFREATGIEDLAQRAQLSKLPYGHPIRRSARYREARFIRAFFGRNRIAEIINKYMYYYQDFLAFVALRKSPKAIRHLKTFYPEFWQDFEEIYKNKGELMKNPANFVGKIKAASEKRGEYRENRMISILHDLPYLKIIDRKTHDRYVPREFQYRFTSVKTNLKRGRQARENTVGKRGQVIVE